MSIKGIVLKPVMEECPYIEGQPSIHENILVVELTNQDMEQLLNIGFRHFGEIFFKPLCAHCRSCISIRIPVQKFTPSKSVKRLFNRNKHFHVTLEKPIPTKETFQLYNSHKKRFKKHQSESYQIYVKSFFYPFSFNRMLCIRDGSHLIAVSHLDVTPHAMSAVYCYFDEKYKKFSPGKLAVFHEIELAKQLGIRWLYLGYHIPQNRHTYYKIQFKPNQFLSKDNRWLDHMDTKGNIIHSLPAAQGLS
ncbi:MAG: arginyltransferase [bacterium]|nr:arginyltransferase [bacterium]